jgi:hypothetical protein
MAELAFLACIEAGNLENQALLLFRSIRRYGGRFAKAPIHSFQPRQGSPLRPDSLEALKALDVHHHTDILNDRFIDYPISNKVFVCAWAERGLDEDILVFCDSDTIFVGEPSAFALDTQKAVALRPVDNRNRGSTGPGSKEDEYWQKLYEICGVSATPFVETTVDRTRIRAYWNAGLIVARRSHGLFQEWENDFLRLMEAGHVPSGQVTFMDQLALAGTLSRTPDIVETLDYRYNYPLPKRSLLQPSEQHAQFEDLIHVHYHRWFNKARFLHALRPPIDPRSEIFAWINEFLPFEPTIDTPLRF